MRTRQSMREVPGWIEASPDLVEAESANVVAQGVRRMESGCNLRKLMPCLLILMSGPLSVYRNAIVVICVQESPAFTVISPRSAACLACLDRFLERAEKDNVQKR